MRSHFKHEIQFVKHRNLFFTISAVLVVLAVAGLLIRGLNFGIEFLGGSQVTFNDATGVEQSVLRDAFADQGQPDAVIQTTNANDVAGFLVRTGETDPVQANAVASAVAESVGIADNTFSVTTIGPNWGGDVTRSMAIAFVVVIALIIVYVSIRYEVKMALMGVLSLAQVLVIVMGIYAWTQMEVNPNVVAALLTIMGYCLYDTVVVFNRVNENIRGLRDGKHRTAMQITNWSENQVFVRSLNTSITSVVPVFILLLFGGDTLKGFAFAMVSGLVLSTYSSLVLAAPAYALWKGREPEWREAEKRYGAQSMANQGDSDKPATEKPAR